jgi:hypothetical protein
MEKLKMRPARSGGGRVRFTPKLSARNKTARRIHRQTSSPLPPRTSASGIHTKSNLHRTALLKELLRLKTENGRLKLERDTLAQACLNLMNETAHLLAPIKTKPESTDRTAADGDIAVWVKGLM